MINLLLRGESREEQASTDEKIWYLARMIRMPGRENEATLIPSILSLRFAAEARAFLF
jgi:hypothetical protein